MPREVKPFAPLSDNQMLQTACCEGFGSTFGSQQENSELLLETASNLQLRQVCLEDVSASIRFAFFVWSRCSSSRTTELGYDCGPMPAPSTLQSQLLERSLLLSYRECLEPKQSKLELWVVPEFKDSLGRRSEET